MIFFFNLRFFGKDFENWLLKIKQILIEFRVLTEQQQASGGCAKLTIDGCMLTLKEKARIEEFCLIRSIFGRNNFFAMKT
jgi:hypothetical protein